MQKVLQKSVMLNSLLHRFSMFKVLLHSFVGRLGCPVSAEIRKPGFKAVTKTFGTKNEAARWSREIEHEMDRGDYRRIEPRSLNEASRTCIQVPG